MPGASNPLWGEGTKLHVWMGLARGNTLTLDDDVHGRLDSGNVLGGVTGTPPIEPDGLPHLWADVSCDVLDVETTMGATTADGLMARAEAGTARIVLADPERRYDPVNPDSTFEYQGVSRLTPGMPVLIWAEIQQFGVYTVRRTLFTGRADSIAEPWTPHPSQRRCTIVASDFTVDLANRDRPELAVPVGDGELAHERVARILDAFGGPPGNLDPSSVVMQRTTLPGTAWEELNKVADAEVGFVFVYVRPDLYVDDWEASVGLATTPSVRFFTRDVWADVVPATTVIPCDVVVGAVVTANDGQVRTRVTGQRAAYPDEPDENERSERTRSVPAAREVGYSRHDLELAEDEVLPWVEFVLASFQRPRTQVTSITMRPAAVPGTLDPPVPGAWADVLLAAFMLERVRLEWQPPGETTSYAVTGRVIGVEHRISTTRWEVVWHLGDSDIVVSGDLLTEDLDLLTTELGESIRLS